jgi:hypothetical protein
MSFNIKDSHWIEWITPNEPNWFSLNYVIYKEQVCDKFNTGIGNVINTVLLLKVKNMMRVISTTAPRRIVYSQCWHSLKELAK